MKMKIKNFITKKNLKSRKVKNVKVKNVKVKKTKKILIKKNKNRKTIKLKGGLNFNDIKKYFSRKSSNNSNDSYDNNIYLYDFYELIREPVGEPLDNEKFTEKCLLFFQDRHDKIYNNGFLDLIKNIKKTKKTNTKLKSISDDKLEIIQKILEKEIKSRKNIDESRYAITDKDISFQKFKRDPVFKEFQQFEHRNAIDKHDSDYQAFLKEQKEREKHLLSE